MPYLHPWKNLFVNAIFLLDIAFSRIMALRGVVGINIFLDLNEMQGLQDSFFTRKLLLH